MNARLLRAVLPHAAISLALLASVSMGVLAPAQRRLATAQAERARLVEMTQVARTLEPVAARMESELALARRELAHIDAASVFARDESRFFDLVMSVARARGLVVSSLQPSTARARAGAQPAAPRAKVDSAGDVVAAYALTISGEYAALAGFLRDVEEQEAFVRIRSLSVAPTSSSTGQNVQAELQIEVLGFDVSVSSGSVGSGRVEP